MEVNEFKQQAKKKLDEAFDKVEELEKKRSNAEADLKEKYAEQLKKANSVAMSSKASMKI